MFKQLLYAALLALPASPNGIPSVETITTPSYSITLTYDHMSTSVSDDSGESPTRIDILSDEHVVTGKIYVAEYIKKD